MAYVSGTVYDDTGAAVGGRTVRAYRRDTGALLSSAITSSSAAPGDANAANTILLLHCDGANGSTTVTDSSLAPKTVTVNGGAAISTAQSKFGGASVYFDGTGDYLSVSPTGFDFGTGDFTIEGWLYAATVAPSYQAIVDMRSSGTQVVPTFSLFGSLLTFYTNGAIRIQSSALSANTWYHVALCRASGVTRMFVDGTQVGSNYTDANNYGSNQVLIGAHFDGNALNGYLDEVRITKGHARYTATFTPQTEAFVITTGVDALLPSVVLSLHGNGSNGSTAIIDSSPRQNTITVSGNAQISTTQSKFGGASLSLDGAGDYVAFDVAVLSGYGGDITIEMFFKLNATPTGNAYNTAFYVLGFGPNSANSGCDFYVGNTQIRFSHYDYSVNILSGSWTPDTTTWHHLAVVRSGSSWTMYLDGASIATATNSTAFLTHTGTAQIGGCEAQSGGLNTGWFNGWIDDYRITKAARYTSNFTPPTAESSEASVATTVGGYYIASSYTGEVNVVCLDDSGGTTYNDLILRTTPV